MDKAQTGKFFSHIQVLGKRFLNKFNEDLKEDNDIDEAHGCPFSQISTTHHSVYQYQLLFHEYGHFILITLHLIFKQTDLGKKSYPYFPNFPSLVWVIYQLFLRYSAIFFWSYKHYSTSRKLNIIHCLQKLIISPTLVRVLPVSSWMDQNIYLCQDGHGAERIIQE